MAKVKYEAVIFDLFGTLVDIFSRREYYDMLEEMALILSVPQAEFTRLWFGTSKQRGTGIFPSIEINIGHICQELGVSIADKKMKEAASVRFKSVARSMSSVKGGIEVTSRLKSEGYGMALISNCSPEAPVIWEELPFARNFDVTVFSCLVGLRKPDPRIYHLAVEQLSVKPESCLYIGDGDGNELSGAAGVGMQPVLFRDSNEDPDDALRDGTTSKNWNGPVITSLEEVLSFLE